MEGPVGLIVARRVIDKRIAIDLAAEQPDGLHVGICGSSSPVPDIPSYHASPEDAAKIARKAGVRHLVLTHVIPPVPVSYLNAAYLGDAGKFFEGPITVGTDGLLFVMPADSEVIRLERLL